MNQERDRVSERYRHASSRNADWCEITPVLCWSPDGRVSGELETHHSNVNEAGVLRRELVESEARCRRAAYILAAAGHDLRQPLQVISMVLDSLAPNVSDPKQLEWLGVAAEEVSILGADLVDLAVTARLTDPEMTVLHLGDVVAGAARSWRYHAANRGLELRVLPSRHLARSNSRLLTTIIRNLVGNAIKHTRAGGVLVGCRGRGGGVRVDVIDTGPGLPRGEVARLFEPHHRGDPNVEGMGLGLAIVRDAVERLGCSMTVKTVLGRGSCFSLMIPD